MKAVSTAEANEIRHWLSQPARHIIEQIAEAHAKNHCALALQAAIVSKKYPAKIESTDDQLLKAQDYATFLEVLKQLTDNPELHQIAVLS